MPIRQDHFDEYLKLLKEYGVKQPFHYKYFVNMGKEMLKRIDKCANILYNQKKEFWFKTNEFC